MSYDDVIPLLGDFGKYQKRIYFLLCLPAILCAFHKLGNVFLIAEPQYRCQLPDEFSNASYHLNRSELEKWYPYNALDQKFSSCSRYNDNKTTISCHDFIYDNDTYGYTSVIEVYGFLMSPNRTRYPVIVDLCPRKPITFGVPVYFAKDRYYLFCPPAAKKWKLTCEKAYLIATGNSLFMFGVMIGSIGFGELSDRWGRKNTFFLSLVIQVVFGIIASFAPEFWTFSIARAVVGATTSGVFLVAYVIGLEMVGPSKRMIAGTVCHMFFSIGYMLTALFAIYITEWRSLQLALTLPGLVFLTYWWIIPESARWLISKNKIQEAKRLIHIAAKSNNITVSDDTLDRLLAPTEDTVKKDPDEKQATILDIFKYPNLRKRSLIIFFDWFANNITYYGLSWNTNSLGGNPYINFVISGAVEIPAYVFLILTLNVWGRKNIMCGCMIVAGTALLCTMIVPKDLQWLTVSLAMVGKLAITASYGAVYIFSTEQFPTVIRNAGLGAGSTCARVGSVTAPYINILTHVWQPLPLLIFGTLALIGGVMSLILPETLNKNLPETIEEGEAFGKKVKNKDSTEEEILSSVKCAEDQIDKEAANRLVLINGNMRPEEES